MVIKTKNFRVNNRNKLDINLLHEFKPLEEYDDVIIECEYLKNGELPRYMDAQEKSINFIRIFTEKAKAVKGIEIEDADGKKIPCDIATLVAMPNPILNSIINNTAAHLVDSYVFTDEEVKN